MKKIQLFTLLLLFIVAHGARAQSPVTSINENFNSCLAGSHSPSDWRSYNPVPGTEPEGVWACGAAYGRSSTGGTSCTGYYGTPASLHLDTSILMTPPLDLSSYTDSIYINFDTKTTNFVLGAKLQVLVSKDTTFSDTTTHVLAMRNVFDKDDSVNWVTHQASLAAYKNTYNLRVGFRFTSQTGTPIASRWYLDNVNTTTSRLPLAGVDDIGSNAISLNILGRPTSDKITIAYTSPAGMYDVCIYDAMGRQLHKETIRTGSAPTTYTISGLQLPPGMYVLKMGNEQGYSVARGIVQ